MISTERLDEIEKEVEPFKDRENYFYPSTVLELISEIRRLRGALEKICMRANYYESVEIARAALGKEG